MAAFKLEDLEAVVLRRTDHAGNLGAVGVLLADGHRDSRDLHSVEAADTIIKGADAGPLQDHAAEIVSDAHKNRARPGTA